MKLRDRIDEIEALAYHTQERMDNLRDYVHDNSTHVDSEYYWKKFEDLLAWSLKFGKNSKEYKRLAETGWIMLGKYLERLLHEFGGKE